MSTNHQPSGNTPLRTDAADHAHEVLDHAAAHHHKKHKHLPKPGMNLNVTAMVDILFNLLVYFIVTANFSMDEGSLKSKLPPPPNAVGEKKEDEIDGGIPRDLEVISTRDTYGCVLRLDGRTVPDMAALRATLLAANKSKNPSGGFNPDLDPIRIKPNAKVRWQHVVNVFNQTVGAGYKKVGFGDVVQSK